MNLNDFSVDSLLKGISSFGMGNDSEGSLGLSNPNIAAMYQGGTDNDPFNWNQSTFGMDSLDNGFSLGNNKSGGIFGDSGLLSKDNLSMGSDIVGMGTGLAGIYNSFQDRSMMKDMVEYGKDSANRNLSNSALLTNQQLADRAAAKNAWNPSANKSYQPVDGSAI